MKFVPSNPIVVILVIIAFFAAGMLAGKMFAGKKKEKFDDAYFGEFNTPMNMADGPKVLPKVPENVGVVSGEVWCKANNC